MIQGEDTSDIPEDSASSSRDLMVVRQVAVVAIAITTI
jgi:hypothetical protein